MSLAERRPWPHIPPADVRLDLFEPTELSTGCPYKGTAAYWSL
jgi:uncharacterized protein (DUF427 family)